MDQESQRPGSGQPLPVSGAPGSRTQAIGTMGGRYATMLKVHTEVGNGLKLNDSVGCTLRLKSCNSAYSRFHLHSPHRSADRSRRSSRRSLDPTPVLFELWLTRWRPIVSEWPISTSRSLIPFD